MCQRRSKDRTRQAFEARKCFACRHLADTCLQPKIGQASKDQPNGKTNTQRGKYGMGIATPNHNTDSDQ
ncbi:hypothetical protein D3C80_1839630 [compost metagenome]